MSSIVALGNLSRDVVGGGPARPGGGVFYATRALARLGADARVHASCALADRPLLLPPLESFGLPVAWRESRATTAYEFHYEGDRRIMRQLAVGDPWSPEEARQAAVGAEWVDVCALVRTDFPPETLAALATGGRRLLFDAHGLVRRPDLGPLRTDASFGDALRHVAVLKLNDEEAVTLVGSADPEAVRSLGVPEALVTFGARGSVIVTAALAERIAAVPIEGSVDPTGAGDTYSVAYLVARAGGAEPVEAARAASAAVAELLSPA